MIKCALLSLLILLPAWALAQSDGERLSSVTLNDTIYSALRTDNQSGLPGTRSNFFQPLSDALIKPPKDIADFVVNLSTPGTIYRVMEISAATGALDLGDYDHYRQTRRYYIRNRDFHAAAKYFVGMGDGTYHFMAAGGFVALGLLFDDARFVKTGGNIIESMLASGAMVQLLKRVSGRESPLSSSLGPGKWRTFPRLSAYQKNQPKYYSFPSGHLTTTVSTLTVLMNNFPEQKWILPLGCVYTTAVAVGLVAKGMHWYSDFPLAIALGYSFGNMIAPRPKDASEPESAFTILPLYHHQQMGVQVAYALK
jgi:hypothetical protein